MPVSWIGRVSQNRIGAQAPRPKAEAEPKLEVKAEQFADTLMSDRIIKQHGAALAPALADMRGLAMAGKGLHTHRAGQFDKAVDQFYSALGRSSTHLAEGPRSKVIKASVVAMGGLAQSLASHPALMPAMAALTSLLEPKGAPGANPERHAEAARTTILDLVEQLEGSQGVSSALFGFRNMVESYESSTDGLTSNQRPGIWKSVGDYLMTAKPITGCDQGELGRIVGLFQRALRDTPDKPKAALGRAKTAALAHLKAPRNAALQQLKVVPEELANNKLGLAASSAFRASLARVIDSNPAGPQALLEAIEELQGKAAAHFPAVNTDALSQAYVNLGKIAESAGQTSASVALIRHLSASIPALVASAPAQQVLARAARIQNPESMAALMVEAEAARIGRDPTQLGLKVALDSLKRLRGGPALQASVTLLPHISQRYAAPLATALHVQARLEETPEDLQAFSARFILAQQHLQAPLGVGAEKVATKLAQTMRAPFAAKVPQRVGQLCTALGAVANADLDKLLDRGREGDPGVFQLAVLGDFLHDPMTVARALIPHIAAADAQDSTELARLVLGISGDLGQLDRNPAQTELPGITKDLAASLAAPGGPDKLVAFQAAHPEIPPALLPTAQQTLDPTQLGWLSKELSSTRSHDYARILRDSVFGAVKQARLDVLSAMATSPADRKAVTACATFIAREHRAGRTAQIPFDRLIEGLKAGQDPVVAIEAESAAVAMGEIGLDGIEKPDPAGMAVLKSVEPAVKKFVAWFGASRHGAPVDHFKATLSTVLKSTADGSWPAPKYNSASAKAHLAPLSEAQIGAWAQDDVTPLAGPVALDNPEMLQGAQLLKGVHETFAKTVKLATAELPDLKWTAASLTSLRKLHAGTLTKLRATKKGSKEFRAQGKAIRPIAQRVALLELQQALKAEFAGGDPEPQALLAAIKPYAVSAAGVLQRLGHRGFAEALQSAADASKDVATNPRTGTYACDDDSIDAYMTPFANGSCINALTGHNRAGLLEKIAGSQYKMIRAMDGDTPKGRGFLRLLRVEMPNGYKGMALFMDRPMGTSSGNPSAQEQKLMVEHAMSKATAMGLPLMMNDASSKEIAEARGLKLEGLNASVFLHKGETGLHHNEHLGPHYQIAWAPVRAGHAVPEAQSEVQLNKPVQVVMPADFKPA